MKTKIFIIIIISLAFQACENEYFNSGTEKECDNILYFETTQDFNEQMREVLKMDLSKKQEWVKTRNFESFGVKADLIYYSVNPEDFKTIEEMKDFVSENSKYLHFVTSESGDTSVETKHFNSPFRYFINDEKIFKIENRIYKVVQDEVVVTTDDNIDKIKQIEDLNSGLINDEDIFLLHSNTLKSEYPGCGTVLNADSIGESGGRRYKIKLNIKIVEDKSGPGTNVISSYKIISRKAFLWIFWNFKNDISASVNTLCHYHHESAGWVYFGGTQTYTDYLKDI
jgi:hypothetical protein